MLLKNVRIEVLMDEVHLLNWYLLMHESSSVMYYVLQLHDTYQSIFSVHAENVITESNQYIIVT